MGHPALLSLSSIAPLNPPPVENQFPTGGGLLMQFGSSQHLKMAAMLDSKAEVQTDPIRKKRLQGLAVAFP